MSLADSSQQTFQFNATVIIESINKNNIDKPKEIIIGEIFAFAYFFDLASEAVLIDAENGEKTKGISFTGNSPKVNL